MQSRFSARFNPHYPFDDSAYQAEILKQEKFLEPGALTKMIPYQPGGGSNTPSPWGSNQSVDAGAADENTLRNYLDRYNLDFSGLINMEAKVARAKPVEFCIKNLLINPGHQLSLQKHQGREEFWIVQKGQLTVIVDGKMIEISEGDCIFIPIGATHCINNCTDKPIMVQELQLGICREEDNVRLLDSTRDEKGHPAPRPTYPITTEVQYQSAILFAELAMEIALQRGLPVDPRLAVFL